MKLFKSKKSLIYIIISAVLILTLACGIFIEEYKAKNISKTLSVAEAQTLVNDTLESLSVPKADAATKIIENSKITVLSVKKGNEKNLILDCEYSTNNIAKVIEENKLVIMQDVYKTAEQKEADGIMVNATLIRLDITNRIAEYATSAPKIEGEITLNIYETDKGVFTLYLEDKIVDKFTGGLLTATKAIKSINEIEIDGKVIDISKKNTLRTGVYECLALRNYDSAKPNTGSKLSRTLNDFYDEFYRNFVEGARWQYLLSGLGTTLSITGLSALIGILLGFLIAIVRCTNDSTGKLKFLNAICKLYLSIIRGTPLMIQLLIMYFVILLPAGVEKFPAAVLCFGLNSAAYVAEIVRGGIMSVDKGQIEAGRSLGFNYTSTMYHVVVPQAFKAALPSLANEFITLLKESSVAFYIGVADLTQSGLKIRSVTYSNFLPLIAVALIYFILVVILTKLVAILEKRLRKSEH